MVQLQPHEQVIIRLRRVRHGDNRQGVSKGRNARLSRIGARTPGCTAMRSMPMAHTPIMFVVGSRHKCNGWANESSC